MSTELLPGFEPAGVLLSIRPVYANLIAAGAKTVELRRRFPEMPVGATLVLYATQPVSAILALARLHSMTSCTLPTLWRRFGGAAAVTKETFDIYFTACTRGLALELGEVTSFTPSIRVDEVRRIWPTFTPPQSYRYVPDGVMKTLRTRSEAVTVEPVSRSKPVARR